MTPCLNENKDHFSGWECETNSFGWDWDDMASLVNCYLEIILIRTDALNLSLAP